MQSAFESRAFVDAFTCLYADVTGGVMVIGTLLWFGLSAMSYIRTGGSIAMPMVYSLILGGAAVAQLAQPVLGFVSILLLGGFALIVVLVARRIETV